MKEHIESKRKKLQTHTVEIGAKWNVGMPS